MINCKIISNLRYKANYFKITFDASDIAKKATPGQFIHLKIEGLRNKILRRPFSINDNENGQIKILYKLVGEGTEFLSTLPPGTICNILGPLGKGFTIYQDKIPVIITGGYGTAATYMLAKVSRKGFLLAGAKSSSELVLIEDYKKLGFEISISTDDGSEGKKALVTELVEDFIRKNKTNISDFAFYACGPEGMLIALTKILLNNKLDAEISLDHMMCCGVGACLACVVRVKKPGGGWTYSRTCKDGPVFNASNLFLD
ncbi:MAG TPA: dihydroorotate dehydrogenase electron transfer subunit [Victivallales bacterium]|nr:dihydroorotate dehydrogenase electron transfer subunit [Victivallales bacterium]